MAKGDKTCGGKGGKGGKSTKSNPFGKGEKKGGK